MGFHFNEAEHAVVPANQIDLAPVMRSADVFRDDAVAPVSEI